MAGPKVTNSTGSLSQRWCDGRDVAFTLVPKYTVRFRKRFHRLYGIEHEVLHLRRVRLSLGMNNANTCTRLKTHVLCLFLCSTTYLLFLCSTRGFCLACIAMRRDNVSSTIATHTRLISEKLTAVVSRLPRTLDSCNSTLPAGLGYEV